MGLWVFVIAFAIMLAIIVFGTLSR